MKIAKRQGRFVAGLLAMAALALALPAGASAANTTFCKGHIDKAKQTDPDLNPVHYRFACSGVITGYSIITDVEVEDFDVATLVYDAKGALVPSDAFNCEGEIPGFGINCTGQYSTTWNQVDGIFDVATKVCAEPRVDPLLVVYRATASGSTVTQVVSGPFDLGRPRGCPKSARNGKIHIPKSDDTNVPAPAAARSHRARRASHRHR